MRGEPLVCDAFGQLHPAVTFGFFLSAILLTVIVQNPFWVAASVVAAALLYLSLRGRSAWKVLAAMVVVFGAVSVINPLFNTQGSTVLFTWFGRPYTGEALGFGMQTAGMFVGIMLWFCSYDRIMTSDRFTYLFGGRAPSLTLVLTMVLRFIPDYLRRARQIADARACVGLSVRQGSLRERVADGSSVLSALTSWALEGAIIQADSMRSRGYGCGPRTQMAIYALGVRDGVVAALGLVLLALALAGVIAGCASAQFVPRVVLPPVSVGGIGSWAAFTGLLLLPFFVNMREWIAWRSSISKI